MVNTAVKRIKRKSEVDGPILVMEVKSQLIVAVVKTMTTSDVQGANVQITKMPVSFFLYFISNISIGYPRSSISSERKQLIT